MFDAEYAQNAGKLFTAFQTLDESTPAAMTGSPVFVDVFDGSTEKFVCGEEPSTGIVGVAATATGTYVAYAVGSLSKAPQTVIARVP
jgi:hypothetical protein